jgi:hypothetical protein
MTSATEKVSSTDIIVRVAGRSREMSSRCIATPVTKKSGTVTTSESSGSSPVSLVKNHARYAARMRNAEWAIITTRITPK